MILALQSIFAKRFVSSMKKISFSLRVITNLTEVMDQFCIQKLAKVKLVEQGLSLSVCVRLLQGLRLVEG